MRYLLIVLYLFCTVRLFAQEPASNPANMQFNSVKAYGITLTFTPSLADGFLVIKSDKPANGVPVDGVVYEKGQSLGNGKIVSYGAWSAISIREVLEGTKYYFAVYAYNGIGGSVDYRQINPLIDSVTTAGFNQDAYFSAIDSSSGTFINDLHNLIYPHSLVSYSAYRTSILPAVYERDTTGGAMVVNCEYSGVTTVYQPPFDFTAQGYNREHALPKSWMLTGGNTNNADGADYHNLLLTRDVPNQKRSNYPLGIVINQAFTFGGSKFGTNSDGNTVFEPQDDRKGDAARNMFYQMICYNGNGGTWGFDYLLSEAPNQDQNVLKLWNAQDPPDKFERTKDEYIYSVQNNRNPFIAFPGWVNCINWDSLVKTNLCGAISSTNDMWLSSELKVVPNPVVDVIAAHFTVDQPGVTTLVLTDIAGRVVLEQSALAISGSNQIELNTTSLESGHYFLTVNLHGKTASRHVVKLP